MTVGGGERFAALYIKAMGDGQGEMHLGLIGPQLGSKHLRQTVYNSSASEPSYTLSRTPQKGKHLHRFAHTNTGKESKRIMDGNDKTVT